MELKDKIKEYRKSNGFTLEEVAKRIGVSKQTVQKYENGIISNIPSDRVEAMAKVFSCTPADLMGWQDSSSAFSFPSNAKPIPKMTRIPLIGEIACGTPILAEQNIEDYEQCPDFVHADFCLRCEGDYMINARIFDGDIVFIRKQSDVENGEIAAVQIDDNGDYNATLKRFYKSDDKITLRAENPTFPDIVLTGENMNRVHIVGKAVYFLSHVR